MNFWHRFKNLISQVDGITLLFCAIAPILPLQSTIGYDMALAVYISYGYWPKPDVPDPRTIPPQAYSSVWYFDVIKLVLYVLIVFGLYRTTIHLTSLKRKLIAFCFILCGLLVAYLIPLLDIGGVYEWVLD
jgi:hypothetical protein